MSGVEIVRLVASDQQFVAECARLYVEVWREPPWLETHWRVGPVRAMIRRQLQLSGAQGYVARADDDIIGFTWGYQASLAEMAKLAGRMDFAMYVSEPVFYLGELAVATDYRRHGIGSRLTRALLKSVCGSGCSAVLLRTDCGADAARQLYASIGFGELPVSDTHYSRRRYYMLPL